MEEFMSISEVGKMLNLSNRTILLYIRSGKIPSMKLNRAYRIRKSDVLALFKIQKTKSAKED